MTVERALRVTVLARQLGIGGAEHQLVLLATGVNVQRCVIDVVSLGDEMDEHWVGPLTKAGITVTSIAPGPVGRRIADLRAALRRTRPHVVHAFHLPSATHALLGRASFATPIITGIRSYPDETYLRPSWWQRAVLAGSTMLVCNSVASAQLLRTRFPRLATMSIRNGVVAPSLDTSGEQRRESRVFFGLPLDAPAVGLVARLVPLKRIDVFLHAVAIARRAIPELTAVVVGDGPERAALVRLTAGLECATAVRFAGLCVDASARLAAFDVVCLSSDTESMPNVLMEAAAAGVPVVATAVGGVAEVVHHGETGYLVSPGNAVAMAERIVQLVTNQPERARMGAAARALACKEFGTSRMVREYERLYATVARPEDRPTVSAA